MTHKEIAVEFRGEAEQVAVIRLMRAAKRNALSDGLVLGLRDVFMNLPASVRAAMCAISASSAARPSGPRFGIGFQCAASAMPSCNR